MASQHNGGSNMLVRAWSRLGLKERAALGGMAVVVSLLTENFVVWVVSATYVPGIEGSPEPLQDNGRIVLEGLATRLFNVSKPRMARRPLQSLRDALNVQYALVSSFGAALVCLELRLVRKDSHRTLAGLAFRGTATLAAARLIRTMSFALTVLPSQVSTDPTAATRAMTQQPWRGTATMTRGRTLCTLHGLARLPAPPLPH